MKKLGNVSFSEAKAFESFRTFRSDSQGWFRSRKDDMAAVKARRKGAINYLRNRLLTAQEKTVFAVLQKNGFKVEANVPIGKASVVDFVVDGARGRTIIEVKRTKTINRRELTKILKNLAYEGYKARFRAKKISKFVALLETRLPLNEFDFEELEGPFDYVCTNVEQLMKVL